jgi:hypothetical protein
MFGVAGGELLIFCNGDITLGEGGFSMNWIGGWVGPKASLDLVADVIHLLKLNFWSPILQTGYCIMKFQFPMAVTVFCGVMACSLLDRG